MRYRRGPSPRAVGMGLPPPGLRGSPAGRHPPDFDPITEEAGYKDGNVPVLGAHGRRHCKRAIRMLRHGVCGLLSAAVLTSYCVLSTCACARACAQVCAHTRVERN